MLGILASFADFERERIKERIQAGLQRARRQGHGLGAAVSESRQRRYSASTAYPCAPPRRPSAYGRHAFTANGSGYSLT